MILNFCERGISLRDQECGDLILITAKSSIYSTKSSASFYKWRSRFGGIDASMMARLKELEDENRRLKKMYAEERLKAEIIQEAMAKKW